MSIETVPPAPWMIEDIMRILPHRYPLLLVDRLESRELGPDPASRVGRKAVAIKAVTMNEQFFTGHFPHRPIMPGVMIIEALAQTCGLCAYDPPPPGHRNEFIIGGIEGARFRRPVVPGDVLEMRVELTKARRTYLTFDAKAFVEGELATEAEIIAYLIPTAVK